LFVSNFLENCFSHLLLSGRDIIALTADQKDIVEEIKVEWKKLWLERREDKVRAEGVAVSDYNKLFVDKGTIIHATRDFKALNFKEILEQHEVKNAERYIPPDQATGGWGKFIKDNISKKQAPTKKSAELYDQENNSKHQPKKSGRGWLHK
jgi:hypothetical protein